MKRIYVDFGKGIDDQVDVAFAGEGELRGVTLCEGERVILYDSSLEVEAVAHEDRVEGRPFWYAIPDWATRKDRDVTDSLTSQADMDA